MFPTVDRPVHRREMPKRESPVRIAAASAAGSILSVTFDQPVVLRGTPRWTTDVAGAVATSAALTGPNTMELTFDVAIAAATSVTVPFEDPAIRSAVGGFVADSFFPLV